MEARKALLGLLSILFLVGIPLCAADNTTNQTTITVNPEVQSTIGFSTDTILWVIYIILLVIGIIFIKKVPALAVLFGVYALVFGIRLWVTLAWYVGIFIMGIGIILGLIAALS